jgi:hypothetical protein
MSSSSKYKSAGRCEKCTKKYVDHFLSTGCKHYQINSLKRNFINWTSGNKKIDDFIQDMQLKLNSCDDKIFE